MIKESVSFEHYPQITISCSHFFAHNSSVIPPWPKGLHLNSLTQCPASWIRNIWEMNNLGALFSPFLQSGFSHLYIYLSFIHSSVGFLDFENGITVYFRYKLDLEFILFQWLNKMSRYTLFSASPIGLRKEI